jgi:hypothetical protein
MESTGKRFVLDLLVDAQNDWQRKRWGIGDLLFGQPESELLAAKAGEMRLAVGYGGGHSVALDE